MSPSEQADGRPNEGTQDSTQVPLGRRAVGGAAVTMAAQAGKIAIQMASVVALARLLTPADYGLIAMVMALIGVADTFRDFGLSSAAIQAATLSTAQRTNLFWVNTGLGATLTGLTCASAPLVAMVFNRPELTTITVAMSVSFLVNGMATQYRADLYRRMEFRRLAVVDISSPLVGLSAAVVAAIYGLGFWALVIQQVATLTTSLLLLTICARWLPGLWEKGASIRSFISFGWRLAGSQLVAYLGNNIDTIMLGLRVTPGQLGLYNRSYQLLSVPISQIRGPLSTVAIPVLARVQDDVSRFHRFVAMGQMVLGYSLVAGLAVVAGAADSLVAILLGSQWVDAVPILRLLAAAAGLQLLAFVGYWVYVSKGLVGELLKYTFVTTSIRIIFVVTGSFFGVIGVAWAMLMAPLVAWPLTFWWLARRASIPMQSLWRGGIRIMAFSIILGCVASGADALVARYSPWIGLASAGAASLVAYGLLALLPIFRRDISACLSLIKDSLPKRGR